jgi:Holin of 3TMs, for gene-transfer release
MALDPVTAVLDIGGKLMDRFWPDPATKDVAKLELFKAQQSGELQILANETTLAKGQLDVNTVEAASTNWFVAGARPFIMWGCGFSMLYAALFEPAARFISTVIFHYNGSFPVIDSTITTQILFGLLGLGGYRTMEKLKGAEGNR